MAEKQDPTQPPVGGDPSHLGHQSTQPSSQSFDVYPGTTQSSVILHIPHSSTYIPAELRDQFVLSDRDLAAELGAATDHATDTVAELADARCANRPHMFVNRVSRLVVDPERFLGDGEPMNAVGLGAVYTRTQFGKRLRVPTSTAEAADRDGLLLDAYYHPYHAAITELVEDVLATHGHATVIDVHSYPAERSPTEQASVNDPRPDVCIGTDPFHTTDDVAAMALNCFSRHGFSSLLNTPYSGTFVPTAHYGRDARVSSLMIEIRRDVYRSSGDSETAAYVAIPDALTEAIAEVLESVST